MQTQEKYGVREADGEPLFVYKRNHRQYSFAVGSNAERYDERRHEGHDKTATCIVSTALGCCIIPSSRAMKASASGTALPVRVSLSPTPKMPSMSIRMNVLFADAGHRRWPCSLKSMLPTVGVFFWVCEQASQVRQFLPTDSMEILVKHEQQSQAKAPIL